MPTRPLPLIVAGVLAALLTGIGAPLVDGSPTFAPLPLAPAPGVAASRPVAPPSDFVAASAQPTTPAAHGLARTPNNQHADDPAEAALGRRTPAATAAPASDPRPTAIVLPAARQAPSGAQEPTPSAEPKPTAAPTPSAKPTAPASPKPAQQPKPSPSPTATREPEQTPKPTPEPTPPARPKTTPAPTTSPKPAPTPEPAPQYSGTSRFWYPALGIDAKWSWYGCDYGGDPDGLGPGVYRWGCGAHNNVYLMSHAWSTFKAVRQGYHSGAMEVGQRIWYADRKGTVSEWRVKWIKRVDLDYFNATAHEWATNDSATPIMTLQTCDGARNQYRIIVRIVPAG
jgi:hypothetical protein